MRTIKVFDKKDYEPNWSVYKRDSARAIIFLGDKLLMVQSDKFGECKFPGGGIEKGEDHTETLVREVKEETGYNVLTSTVKEFCKTLIRRKGEKEDEIFEQESFYYFCDIDEAGKETAQVLEDYEREYGHKFVLVSVEDAISANEKALSLSLPPLVKGWTERDLEVLKEVLTMCAK